MKKIAAILFLTLVSVYSYGQEATSSTILPESPSLAPQPGDDQTFPITIAEARVAEWYASMYPVARGLASELQSEVDTVLQHEKLIIDLLDKKNAEIAILYIAGGLLLTALGVETTLLILR